MRALLIAAAAALAFAPSIAAAGHPTHPHPVLPPKPYKWSHDKCWDGKGQSIAPSYCHH